MGLHQFGAGRVVGALHVLRIGGVDNQENIVAQPVAQSGNLVGGQIGAGRVVGVCQEQDACLIRHRRQQGIDVSGEIRFWCRHWRRAGGLRRNGIHQEPVLAVDHLIAGAGIGLAQQADELIRTRSADHARRINAVDIADGVAQRRALAIRIAMQFPLQRGVGFRCLGARAERAFIGTEFDDLFGAVDV